MAYDKSLWVDQIVDPDTGEVIQIGTRVTAQRMNNIEEGIENAAGQVAVVAAAQAAHSADNVQEFQKTRIRTYMEV